MTGTTTTPFHAMATSERDGVHVVRDTGTAWLDGSEDHLFSLMTEGGHDLSSGSDELYATARTWPERYHLSTSRANVVRALDLPADATVLEIGAGCGAITRYLGETCARVDALEPTFARARVAAARTADLPGVRVHLAEVADLPAEPAYDVVVVVGVLEYVGSGTADADPYRTFLERLRATLRPGGRLVLAIENQLGVKYWAGAPEDHSHQVYDSVEGYPVGGPARTFSRSVLTDLVRSAGYGAVDVLGAFPDYKLTRLVLGDRLLELAPGLAVDVPRFPSPDWVRPRPAVGDERRMWQQVVQAGLGMDMANSFLVVATAGESDATSPLWPRERLGRYFSMLRRSPFQVAKTVVERDGAVLVESRPVGSGAADGLRVLGYTEEWCPGEDFVDVVVAEPGRLDAAVGDWSRLLRERTEAAAAEGRGVPFDVVPHNIHYVGGTPRLFDDEWRATSLDLDGVLRRGALLLVRDLLDRRAPQHWGVETWVDLVRRVAASAGLDLDGDAVERTVRDEAELQATVGGAAPGSARHDEIAERVERDLRHSLEEARHGVVPPRAWELAVEGEAEAVRLRDLLFATGTQLDEARAGIERLEADLVARDGELAELRAELTQWQSAPLRRTAGRVARQVRESRRARRQDS